MDRKKKLKKYLELPLIDMHFKLPVWFVIYAVSLPIFAYGDLVFLGRRTFWGYLLVSVVECALVMVGYTIANIERVDKQ